MSWNLEGKEVSGKYLGEIPFTGVVSESRVAYGKNVKHIVELDEPITYYGATRKMITVETNQYGEYVNFEIND